MDFIEFVGVGSREPNGPEEPREPAIPKEGTMYTNINPPQAGSGGLSRRDFIRYALTGIAGAVVGGAVAHPVLMAVTAPKELSFDLAMTEALVQMIDGRMIFHWAYEDLNSAEGLPRVPGPLIQATEGDSVRISITNNLPAPHGFRIAGMPGMVGRGISVDPGMTEIVTFVAPAGGTYMYFDDGNGPVNRILGLHGPVVIMPRNSNTPYSNPTPAVQQLFNDLGATAHFPGEPWKPERSKIWVFNAIDPKFNERAQQGIAVTMDEFVETYLPRYYTINGLSGGFASHDEGTVPKGRVGQPHVIRLLNVSEAFISPHIHANHV